MLFNELYLGDFKAKTNTPWDIVVKSRSILSDDIDLLRIMKLKKQRTKLFLKNGFYISIILQIFIRIMLPLALPAIFTVAIVNFGGAWNDYIWPLVSASEQHMRTLQVGMSLQLGNRLSMYMGTSLAGIIISTIPTIFLLVYFQKYLLRGFAIGTK